MRYAAVMSTVRSGVEKGLYSSSLVHMPSRLTVAGASRSLGSARTPLGLPLSALKTMQASRRYAFH